MIWELLSDATRDVLRPYVAKFGHAGLERLIAVNEATIRRKFGESVWRELSEAKAFEGPGPSFVPNAPNEPSPVAGLEHAEVAAAETPETVSLELERLHTVLDAREDLIESVERRQQMVRWLARGAGGVVGFWGGGKL